MPALTRRALRPLVAWLVAAAAAVAVASWGVALVGRSVTDDRPEPLSAAQVQDRLTAASGTSTPAAGPTPPAPATSAPTPGGEPLPGPTTATATPGTAPPATPAPGPAPSSPGPGTAAPAATTPPATVAPAPEPAPETRTYQVVGGTASLRFEPGGVTVVFANPAQGFDVEVEPAHGGGVRVEFESETHRSRIDAWWDGGPRDEVQEQGDDDG